MIEAPSIAAVRKLRDELSADIVRTPLVRCAALEGRIGGATRVYGKLEFLQRTGTFKARGALAAIRALDPAQRAAGVTAVSAGNHAIATAFAARTVGTTAKVVMIASANPMRVEVCRDYGAEVVMADDAHQAFEMAEDIRDREGRYLMHPFEGPAVAAGTATVGLEICEQCEQFDTVVVPVGGGGLIAGIASSVKRLRGDARVIGVEPEGADTMFRSLAAGKPCRIDKVRTIADSLGAPYALPYSFALCQRYVDDLVRVDDVALRRAMGLLFASMKIAVEPACAATTAALVGPLRGRLQGQTVVVVFCGSNIDWQTFAGQAIFEDAYAA